MSSEPTQKTISTRHATANFIYGSFFFCSSISVDLLPVASLQEHGTVNNLSYSLVWAILKRAFEGVTYTPSLVDLQETWALMWSVISDGRE